MATGREMFETWAREGGYNTERLGFNYASCETEVLWQTFHLGWRGAANACVEECQQQGTAFMHPHGVRRALEIKCRDIGDLK